MFLLYISRKKNCSESDYNNIVILCRYRYNCDVDSALSQIDYKTLYLALQL